MKRVSKLALSCLLVPALLAACSSKETNEKAPEPGQSSSPSASAGNESAKPVEISMVREKSGVIKFRSGETMDKNTVSDAYEKELGIKIKNLWVADSSQYQQKLQMSISSNDIPDLMFVNADQFQQLIEADMLMDLNGVYEKTASPETKAYLTSDGGMQMDSAKQGGKLLAIPATNSPYNAASHIWIRKDWLDKLGLQQPKTMQDLLKITEAFTKQDPGGTGKSYGLPLTKNVFIDAASDAFAITGFFNGFHAYPGQWVKDTSGKLVYGSVQPEMKAALKQLQEMYKAGQIDPEFAVKDMVKENELVASNKIGVAYGPFWLSVYPLQDGAVKDGKVVQNWVPYPIVSVDDKPAMTQAELGVDGYWVVSKKAKNPEAVIKLLNKWVQVLTKPTDEDKKTYLLNTEEAQSYWLLNPIRVFSQDQNTRNGEVLPKAIQNKDQSLVQGDADQLDRYNKVMKYLGGDLSQWGEWGISGPGGAFSIMSGYLKDKRFQINGYTGAPGPVMTEKKPVLETKMNEVYIKIIMNQLPIDEFDKFVEDWKKIGGDAMTEEVNKLYAKTGKK
ncbi:extracellular solute-binding protein [Paenibacillus contaminans]|uniref:ABC transporter substrate-binding protein n=1 Tax=Paenibacillus contaminans TaxID=450362 RepID=A0A329ML90_9BACL|nr:extracellular solute-binding protein [Paenibacillus contaminans]RAV20400.1 ABC transporter substrate-binding protein [Paenibacillus contaminans]